MATPAFKFTFDPEELKAQMRELQRPVAEAAHKALHEAASTSVREGKQNIASAGRFTGTWLSGLKYAITPKPSLFARATVFHTIGLAGVFQTGLTIKGQPLLWLPIRENLPARVNSPREYGGRLVSVNVAGHPPMLFAALPGPERKPLFIGVREVRIPKKFSVIEIVERAAKRMGEFFIKHFKD